MFTELRLDEIYSVEIVGGSSRIAAIKHLIETVFNKGPSTTLYNITNSSTTKGLLPCKNNIIIFSSLLFL